MNKYTLTLLLFFFIFILTGGIVLMPMRSYAQNNQDFSNTNFGNSTDYASIGSGWVWLLPLVAIPIIYFIWKGASAPHDETNYSGYNQALVGVKGGEKNGRKEKKRRRHQVRRTGK